MKKLFILICLVTLGFTASAQLGLNARYNSTTADNWNNIINHDLNEEEMIFQNSFEYGLDYWIGMEYIRIEYFPEVSYSRTETEVISLTEDLRNYKQQTFSFTAKTNIYPFNFSIDRPCPTNQLLNFLQKGFFIQLAPGLSYFINDSEMDGVSNSTNTIAYKLGAGVGFDMRLGDAIFITPYFRYNYYPGVNFDGLYEAHNFTPQDGYSNESKVTQTQIGIRIGIVPKILMRKSTFY